MDLHVAKLRNCMRLWIIFHKVDVPAGTSWPLLARCPACGSILTSDHLPSNPLVFAFWVVANGRLDCTILGKSHWDSDTVFVPLQNNVTLSVLPSRPVPSPYTMLKLGKNSGYMRPNLFMGLVGGGGGGGGGGGEEMGMRFLRSLVLDFAQTSALFVGRDVCRMRVNWPHSVSVSSIAPIEQWKTFALLASYIIISCRLQMESVIVLCH